MDFEGFFFPGVSTPATETQSQRNYNYDPMGSLSRQATHYPEHVGPSADNMTVAIPQTTHRRPGMGGFIPQDGGDGFLGNIELMKVAWFSDPGWWRGAGVGGFSHDWNGLRQAGVGYGLYAPHLPQQPIPAYKLYEAGGTSMGGFVVPATFLGQPLIANASPPGA
jgi:hypothetical protein